MKERIKKQLLGYLHTPPLWRGELLGLKQFEAGETEHRGLPDPKEAIPSLATNFVLGKRMESFFQLLIQSSDRYRLLANNIQISREKITLGEMDFLLKDTHTNQNIHLELVYKFYVYDPSFSSEEARWIGPNRRDSFLQKMDKLKQKQFPLLYQPETREYLKTLKLTPEDHIQQTYFKAKLFLPKALNKHNITYLNQECIAGYYLSFNEFDSTNYRDFKYYAPPKQDWPIAPKFGTDWVSFSEIKEEIKTSFKKKKSPLIWMKRPNMAFEAFFVVWW